MHVLTSPLFRLTTIVLAVACFAGCSAEAKKNRIIKRADDFYQKEEFDKAKIEYLNVLKADPQNAKANERLGLIWFDQGSPLRAGQYLLKARDAMPTNNAIRAKLGMISLAAGKVAAARKEAISILDRSPGNDDALLLLAGTIRTPEDFERTEQELRKTTDRGSVTYQLVTANLSLRKGDVAEAKKALQRAVAIDPKSPAAHSAMAAFHQGQNNAAEAAKEFQTAAELSPIRSAARLKYAEIKAQSSKDEGIAYLKDITQKAPDYLPAWTSLAHIAVTQKKYDEATELLKNVFSRDRDNYDAHLLRGQMLLAKDDKPKAIEYFKRLGTAYPAMATDKYFLARAHLMSNQPTEAAAVLRKAIANQPDYDEAILLLAELDLKARQPQPVVVSMVGLLTRRPNLVRAQVFLADALRAMGRFDDAIKVIREQIRISPQSGQPHVLLGMVFLEQKKLPDARASFERALELSPAYLPAVMRLVNLDLEEKNFAAALKRARAQVQAAPSSADALFLEARIQAAQGKWKEANVSLRKAIELDVNHSPSYGLLLYGMIANKELAQAIQELEGLRVKSPTNTSVLMLSGGIYVQMKEAEKARDTYEKLLTIRPDASLALNNLACLYADHFKQLDRAYELASKARKLEPASAPVADTLGWIQFRRKEYPAALELLTEAAAGMPDNPEVQYHLAMANQMAGQTDAARAGFQKAASAKEDFPGKDQIKEQLARLGEGIPAPAVAK